MAELITGPTVVEAEGTPAKLIQEFIGQVNTGSAGVSIARMTSPHGWREPGQTPEFDEFSIVLEGSLHIQSRDGEFDAAAGQAVFARAGEWVQYSTPSPEGAVYIAVCIPAFSPDTVNRDEA